MPTCIHCGHKHYTYEPHVPGVPLYYPWDDIRVNAEAVERHRY
jgi:hypothetical protein